MKLARAMPPKWKPLPSSSSFIYIHALSNKETTARLQRTPMALATNCYRLALLSTVLFNRFSSSPTTLPPFHTPPSSAPFYTPPRTPSPSPSATLLSHGYSLMSFILDYASDNLAGWNSSGTLFAPSDSAFLNHRRLPPHPTPSTLLYHTARMPSLLSLYIPPGSSLPTLSLRRHCIFLRQTPSGELCVTETPFRRNNQPCIKIRDPDLYHDGNLAIHGIDGVLDPSIAQPCWHGARRSSAHVVDAVNALRRMGYVAVADAMLLRRSELARFPAVTVFAPRYIDGDLDGFREAIGRHVVPRRYDVQDLARLSMGQRLRTIDSSREIMVGFDADGTVTVDGVSIDGDAIYRNRWAVILPVGRQIGSSSGTPEESSNGGKKNKAGDVGQSEKLLTRGVDPTVVMSDEWCNAGGTVGVGNIAPCPATAVATEL